MEASPERECELIGVFGVIGEIGVFDFFGVIGVIGLQTSETLAKNSKKAHHHTNHLWTYGPQAMQEETATPEAGFCT